MADFKENKFDEVFRKKLLNYEETPPDFIYNKLKEHFSNSSVSYTKKILSNKYLYIISSVIIIGIATLKIFNNSNTKNFIAVPKNATVTLINKGTENRTIVIKNKQSNNKILNKVSQSNSNINSAIIKENEISGIKNDQTKIIKIDAANTTPSETFKSSVVNIGKDTLNVSSNNSFAVNVSFKITPSSCKRDNGSITANVEGNYKNLIYSWYPSENNGNNSDAMNNLYSGEYHLKITNGNYYEIFDIFVPDSGITNANFMHTELEQTVSIPIYYTNTTKVDGEKPPSGMSYKWSFGDGTYSYELNPEHIYTSVGNFSVKLVAKSKYGCEDSITVSDISISSANPEAPNVFSPNGDGINDIFKPKVKPSKDFTCTIMNKDGKTVYEWHDQNTGWDGKINNTPAAVGIYYYIIKGTGTDNRKYLLRGSLLLVR